MTPGDAVWYGMVWCDTMGSAAVWYDTWHHAIQYDTA